MVSTADSVEWITVRNEVEALFLEFNLIKKHRPRFNIRLKDDKSYPYLAITLDEECPGHGDAGRQAQGRPLLRPLRPRLRDPGDPQSAAAHVPDPHVHQEQVRPARPPRAPVPLRPHREVRGALRRRGHHRRLHGSGRELIDFLDGDTAPILDRLDKQMHEASDELEFERAARLRDQILSVRKAIERQQMVDAKEEDYDALGIVDDPLEASVQLFMVRKGRSSAATDSWSTRWRTSVEPSSSAGCSSSSTATLEGADSRGDARPRRRPTTSTLPGVPRAHRGSRGPGAGAPTGAKRELLATVTQNARRGLQRATSSSPPPTTTRAPGAGRAAGRARIGRCPVAHRVLRHLEPPGHRDRRVDGGDGGRPAQAVRLPPLQDPPPARPGRLRGMEEVSPGASAATSQDRDEGAAPGGASPTRPTW